jgi:hypothetical protein
MISNDGSPMINFHNGQMTFGMFEHEQVGPFWELEWRWA